MNDDNDYSNEGTPEQTDNRPRPEDGPQPGDADADGVIYVSEEAK